MNLFDLMRGPIRHMKLIGQHPSHMELRARNEQRLAKLKAERRLTEEKETNVNTATPSGDSLGPPIKCDLGALIGPRNQRPIYIQQLGRATRSPAGSNSLDLVDDRAGSSEQRGQDAGVWPSGGWQDGFVRDIAPPDPIHFLRKWLTQPEREKSD